MFFYVCVHNTEIYVYEHKNVGQILCSISSSIRSLYDYILKFLWFYTLYKNYQPIKYKLNAFKWELNNTLRKTFNGLWNQLSLSHLVNGNIDLQLIPSYLISYTLFHLPYHVSNLQNRKKVLFHFEIQIQQMVNVFPF